MLVMRLRVSQKGPMPFCGLRKRVGSRDASGDRKTHRIQGSDPVEGRPAEYLEEGAVHGSEPALLVALREDDLGAGVGGQQLVREHYAGSVGDGLVVGEQPEDAQRLVRQGFRTL